MAYHCLPNWVRGGFVGVDIFFVISGYLIGSLIYKEIRGRSFSISRFYERRAKRILPALFGVLLFSYIAAYAIFPTAGLKMFSTSALATATSTSNVYFYSRLTGYFAQNSDSNPLLMTWSLGVEEQFYIFIPLLMLLMRSLSWRKQFWGIGILAFLSLAATIWGTTHFQSFAFFMLPTRAWELAAGVLLAIFEANQHSVMATLQRRAADILSLCGLALIGIAILAFNQTTPFPGWAAMLPVAGSVLVIAAREGMVNRVLSFKPFVFIGLVSYSWYLWHWPLLSFARNIADSSLSLPVSLGIGAASFGCAALSHRLIEQPFRRSHRAGPRLLLGYGFAAALVMVPALAFHASGLHERNRAIDRLEAERNQLASDSCLIQEPNSTPHLLPPCDPNGHGPAIALVGDSHAAQLAATLRTISAKHGYRLLEFTKGWCPPLGAGVTRSVIKQPNLTENCAAFNRNWIASVAADPEIKIVIAAAWWSDPFRNASAGEAYLRSEDLKSPVTVGQSAANLAYGLQQLMTKLNSSGKTIYLVQDNPQIAFDPLSTMETRVSVARRTLAEVVAPSTVRHFVDRVPVPDTSEDEEARSLIEAAVRLSPNGHVIDLRKQLCTGYLCRIADRDESLYIDNAHLSPFGAQVALSAFNLR